MKKFAFALLIVALGLFLFLYWLGNRPVTDSSPATNAVDGTVAAQQDITASPVETLPAPEDDLEPETQLSDERVRYRNHIYGFSVEYPSDWTYEEIGSQETTIETPSTLLKFYVTDYDAAAEEEGLVLYTQPELEVLKREIATDEATELINNLPVRIEYVFDQSSAYIVRVADFFVGLDYVRFSTPVRDLLDPALNADTANINEVAEGMIETLSEGKTISSEEEAIVQDFYSTIQTLEIEED